MGSLIQQDLFKKANHRMVILTSFHPGLEEKQKHRTQKFERLRGLQNVEGQHLQLRNQREKMLTKIYVVDILEAKEKISVAK